MAPRSASASLVASRPEPLEAAGGIATALPLLPRRSGADRERRRVDRFRLRDACVPRAERMARDPASPRAHLVMVPCTPSMPRGDFVLRDGMLRAVTAATRFVYGNIGLHDTALFAELRAAARLKMLPLWQDWIRRGWVSGETLHRPVGEHRHARRSRAPRMRGAGLRLRTATTCIHDAHDHESLAIRCSILRPAALRRDSSRHIVTRRRRACCAGARAAVERVATDARDADTGTTSSRRSRTRSTASIARGARSVT